MFNLFYLSTPQVVQRDDDASSEKVSSNLSRLLDIYGKMPSSTSNLGKEKVCIIGSGNWASAISLIIGSNTQTLDFCQSDVNMYVYDEIVTVPTPTKDNGRGETIIMKEEKLSHVINTRHENVKYLPNIKLPPNIVAVPDLVDAIKGASLLIFCLPHQFLKPILHTIRDNYHLLHPNGCRGVSLIKGMDYDPDSKSPILISKVIQDTLNQNRQVNEIPFSCGVLMGANVANGVARKQICESTLATNYYYDPSLNKKTVQIFNNPHHFRVQHTKDIYGTEACGALKNIIALGCGFVDSLYDKDKIDEGSNTKAALIRIGLLEMKRFSQLFLNHVENDTFWQSCGVADLITTCYSGRNYKCAKVFGSNRQAAEEVVWNEEKCQQEWTSIENSLLNGQKLQGTLTSQEIYAILSSRNLLTYFPLMNVIYKIAFEGKDVYHIVDGITAVDESGVNLDIIVTSNQRRSRL